MKTTSIARVAGISFALAFCAGAMAQTMSKDQYSAQKDKISADYKVAKAACDPMSGNARDICKAEAKGREDVAKADLEAAYEPSDKATYKARIAKADADYEVANEKCDDLKGNDKTVCVKAAKDAKVHATANAKTQMETNKAVGKAMDKSADATDKAAAKIADARHDAAKDKREADYALAKAKCDALSGNAKDACVTNAKTTYAQ